MRLSILLPMVLGAFHTATQKLPLSTQSRWIMDSSGQRIKMRCINWAGHMETHIPEGLNKQSVDHIADFVKDQGFNCVRLTYSIDYALSPDTKVRDAFSSSAGAAGVSLDIMNSMYEGVLKNNPSFSDNTTTQEVHEAVVSALWDRKVMTILDNHVSKAKWCCNPIDGNGWWDEAFGYNALNSEHFNTTDWLSGLAAQATWARQQPGVAAMSLRNELRPLLLQDLNNHDDWYKFITMGAQRVHSANPDVLIIVGGSQSATDLSFVRTRPLDVSSWQGKHVWEMHSYSFTVTFPDLTHNCDVKKTEYGALDGFVLEQGKAFTAPLIVSEFGVGLGEGSETTTALGNDDAPYFDCLRGYMESNDADWALWGLQGSYYIREGKTDVEETWGLMDKDWRGIRNKAFREMLDPLFNITQGP